MAEMNITEGTGISKKLLIIAAVLLGGAFLLKSVGGKGGKGGGKRRRAKGKGRKVKAWMLPMIRAKRKSRKRVGKAASWRVGRGSKLYPIPAFPR